MGRVLVEVDGGVAAIYTDDSGWTKCYLRDFDDLKEQGLENAPAQHAEIIVLTISEMDALLAGHSYREGPPYDAATATGMYDRDF